jgi:signal transduction histidine kinase
MITKARVDAAIRELDNVVRDVRSYIFELQPQQVADKGLEAAIKQLGREYEVNTLAEAEMDLDPEACALFTEGQKRHVIFIVREALSNTARHAGATWIRISCERGDGALAVAIEDNGIGFDVDSVTRGHGLRNMPARAEELNGSLTIGRRSPRGLRHELVVPIEPEASSHD